MTPCQILIAIPVACATCALTVTVLAIYESWQQTKLSVEARTIAAAQAQTDKWLQWNQEASEEDTAIEPALPEMESFDIDESPMREMDQDDRAHIQALMLTKAIATWLEEESCQFPVEGEIAVRAIAQSLRQNGLAVLERNDDA